MHFYEKCNSCRIAIQWFHIKHYLDYQCRIPFGCKKSVFLHDTRLWFPDYKTYLSIIIGGTQIITNKRKNTGLYKIMHFYMQFSAIVNRFILKTQLNSAFTNDLKRKEFFSKNVQSYRLCSFKDLSIDEMVGA